MHWLAPCGTLCERGGGEEEGERRNLFVLLWITHLGPRTGGGEEREREEERERLTPGGKRGQGEEKGKEKDEKNEEKN